MKKLHELLKEKTVYMFLLLVIIMFLVQIIINIFNQNPYFQNIGRIFLVTVLISICWLVSKLTISTSFKLLISFCIMFIYQTISMFFNNSYADYTSFIVIGIISLFFTLLMLIPISNNKR